MGARGEEDFEESDASELDRDVSLSKIQQDFANRELEDLKQAHSQRGIVFKVMLGLILFSLVSVVVLTWMLGTKRSELATPVAVAIIVGLTVHPLAVLGFLVRALFSTQKKGRDKAAE